MSEAEQEVPLDKLAKVYRKIRTAIQELTAEYDAKVAALKEQQQTLANAMKDEMKRLNVTSARTAEGTVSLVRKTRYYATDWDAFKKFVLEEKDLDLLEHRIAQRNMAVFLTNHPDAVPPGLNSDTEITVVVRKPD